MSASHHKDYPTDLEPGTSHAHAVALVAERAAEPGLVLDIGCGNAPLAGAIGDLGHHYVGVDVDRRAVDGLVDRGVEAHRVDLTRSGRTLVAKLDEVVGDRALRAVLALDVLEHLVDPRAVVEAVATVAARHPGCLLVVSIPNVTHVEVGIRLLLGQWHMTEFGLLDDTHLRFFSHDGVAELMAGTGWRQTGALDTVAVRTEQYDAGPGPGAGLEAHAPLSRFLRSVRAGGDPYAETYQFVRRYELAPDDRAPAPAPASGPNGDESPTATTDRAFVTAIVRVDTDADAEGLPRLLAELAAQDPAGQDPADVEVLVLVTGDRPWADQAAATASAAAHVAAALHVPEGVDNRNTGIARATGRYLWFVDGRTRVAPGAVAAFRRGAPAPDDPLATDAVIRVDAAIAPPGDGPADGEGPADDRPFAELVVDAVRVDPDGFDLLRPEPAATVLAAYAIPASVARDLGVAVDARVGDAATTELVARAVEVAGLRGVGGTQVLVDPHDARDGALDAAPLRDSLSRRPFLLGRGGVARLVEHRRALALAERELARRDAELDRLEAALADARQERDRAVADVQRVLAHPVIRALSRVKRLADRVRRRLRLDRLAGRPLAGGR